MRQIRKGHEPRALTNWRIRYQTDINLGYDLLRGSPEVIADVMTSLLREQGWLCAYTGRRIDESSCHIEHIKAQDYCTKMEKVTYANLLACYPRPNRRYIAPYGAQQKDNWPPPEDAYLFVSPLSIGCEARFEFNVRGKIAPRAGDLPAATTISKLKLDHEELTDLRRGAIRGTLGNHYNLPIDAARRRLRTLKAEHDGRLEPYCFVLVQALEKHIARVETLAKSKKAKT